MNQTFWAVLGSDSYSEYLCVPRASAEGESAAAPVLASRVTDRAVPTASCQTPAQLSLPILLCHPGLGAVSKGRPEGVTFGHAAMPGLRAPQTPDGSTQLVAPARRDAKVCTTAGASAGTWHTVPAFYHAATASSRRCWRALRARSGCLSLQNNTLSEPGSVLAHLRLSKLPLVYPCTHPLSPAVPKEAATANRTPQTDSCTPPGAAGKPQRPAASCQHHVRPPCRARADVRAAAARRQRAAGAASVRDAARPASPCQIMQETSSAFRPPPAIRKVVIYQPHERFVQRPPFPSTRVRQQLWACMPDHACQQRVLHTRGPLHTQGMAAGAHRLSLSVRCRPARRTPREPPPRTAEPLPGRQHADLQTDTFLEELTDVVAEEVAGTSRTLVHDPDVTCQAALGEHSGVSCRSWLSRITACRHADRCLPAAAADAALRAAQARRGRGDADR